MKTAIVNGQPMNASEIADYIRKTTGYAISREAVLVRMNRGLPEEQLTAAPWGEKRLTVTIERERMDGYELSAYIEDTRGYFVPPAVLRKRIQRGTRGEALLAPLKQWGGNRRKPTLREPEKRWGRELVRTGVPGWGAIT